MGQVYHFRERNGKKFAVRNPERIGKIGKQIRATKKWIDDLGEGKLGFTYEDRDIRRPVWKKIKKN